MLRRSRGAPRLARPHLRLQPPRFAAKEYVFRWNEGLIECAVPITPDMARLVGFYMGDGSLQGAGKKGGAGVLSIACDRKDQDVVNEVRRLVETIFGVEVPTSAEGFLAIKEDFVFPAHFPIKELHSELFSAGGPGLKLFGGAEERAVGANFEWNAGLFGGEFEFSENAVVARFDKDEFSGAELGHRFDKLFPERMGIG